MSRLDVTEKIIATKVAKGLKWADVAKKVGKSKEWVTAACLGQMTLNAEQAATVAKIFGLSAEDKKWLMVVPYKGSLPTSVPTDPLIYRFYELVSVYGTTFKELIHEEFGDGIMSAIDFRMDLTREPDPKGDRVVLVYTHDTRWRNRAEFPVGREAVREFLQRKWARELEYRLIKELWACAGNRIAVRFAYEWHDDAGHWTRSYGNENWEFNDAGYMMRRFASINDLPINERARLFRWPLGRRPDEHPGLTDLGL